MAGILQRWLNKSLLKKYDRVSIPVTDLHDNADYQMGAFELGQVVASNPDIGTLDRIYGVATNLDEGGDYNIDNLKEPGRYTWTTKVPDGIAIEGRTTENNKYGSLTVTKVGSGNDRKQVLNFGIDNTQYSRTNPGGNNPWGPFKQAATLDTNGYIEKSKLAKNLESGAKVDDALVANETKLSDGSVTKVSNNATNVSGKEIIFNKQLLYSEGTLEAGWYDLGILQNATQGMVSEYNISCNVVSTRFCINLKIVRAVPWSSDSIFSITKDSSSYIDKVGFYDFDGNYRDYKLGIHIAKPITELTINRFLPLISKNEIKITKRVDEPKYSQLLPDGMAFNGVAIPDINGSVKSLLAKDLKDGTDLDTIKEQGEYNLTYALYPNSPTPNSVILGRLRVSNSAGWIYQTLNIMTGSANTLGTTWTRVFYQNESRWRIWEKVVKEKPTTLQAYNQGIME